MQWDIFDACKPCSPVKKIYRRRKKKRGSGILLLLAILGIGSGTL